MGRPPIALGTAGKVRVVATTAGYRARALYRDYDGVCRAIERHRPTKAAAEAALKLAVRDRARLDGGSEIKADTRVSVLAEAWFASLQGLSPTTMQAYRNRLDQQVIPGLGNLRVRELTVGVVDRHLRAVTNRHGSSTAKMTKSVLSGLCGLAARHDALERNPVRDSGGISTKPKRAPKALRADQAQELLGKLRGDEQAIARDIPDLVAFMLGSGVRIGEAAAVTWDDFDDVAGTVDIDATIVRVTGQGLLRKSTKTDTGARTLLLPSWCAEMLRERAVLASTQPGWSETAPIFPAPLGGWRDPSNTQTDLRAAFTATGFEWITSHVLRKTVATLMDQAGLSSRAAADQLGHANPSMTHDRYMGRQVASTGAAAVLECLGLKSLARGFHRA